MGLGSIIGGIASAAAAAYSIASAPGMPKPPNLAQATWEGVLAEALTLPARRQYEAAAALGQPVLQYGMRKLGSYEINSLRKELEQNLSVGRRYVQAPDGKWYVWGKDQIQAQINALDNEPYMGMNGQVLPKNEAYAQFQGYGQGEVQSRVAAQQAANQLDLSRKYDPQFIEEALKQEALADPEGTAARQKMYDLIQQQIEAKPDRPVADLLDKQIGEQLAAGNQLTPAMNSVLDDAVAKAQAARGQTGTAPEDFAAPLTTGFAGEQREQAGAQKALSWLSSGATPEDVQYRREQQNMANLGAFTAGTTPQSQFASLSGAQQGPVAMWRPNLSTENQNAGQTARQYDLGAWQTQLNASANQANPWMAGLSALLSGASAAGSAGWRGQAGG